MTPRQRYQAAHETNFKREYPAAYKDRHYFTPTYPAINTSNGLTKFVIDFLNWNGHRATRINVNGRLVEQPETQESGVVLSTKKWIKSSTKKGTADISATIHGRAAMLEIKCGKDKPRPAQLLEQQRERKAGGVYEFIYTPEQFLAWYDSFVGMF